MSFEESSSWVNRLFLYYLDSLLQVGSTKTLSFEDLGPTSRIDTCSYLYERFEKEWQKEEAKPFNKRSLWFPLWRVVGKLHNNLNIHIHKILILTLYANNKVIDELDWL